MVKLKALLVGLCCAVAGPSLYANVTKAGTPPTLTAVSTFAVAIPAQLENPYPQVATAYGVLSDNQWLWGKQVEKAFPQASLTKLMTAVLSIENGKLDQFTTVSVAAAKAKPMKAKVRAGDRIKQRDLLNATLIASANDTCLALAEAVAKTETRFVMKMNVRARELGLKDTHFENACGFDERGHQSSVRDLVTLTNFAMSKPEIIAAVKQKEFLLPRVGKKAIKLKSTNALLRQEGNGVIGVKTGFTNHAGRCLIAMAKRDQHTVTLILLNARNRWWNAAALIEKAFAHAGAMRPETIMPAPESAPPDGDEADEREETIGARAASRGGGHGSNAH